MKKSLRLLIPLLPTVICVALIALAQGAINPVSPSPLMSGSANVEPVGSQGAAAAAPAEPVETQAACTGGTAPAVEGTTLTECYQRNLTVGGNARTIRVWYTTDTTEYTVDSVLYKHWIAGESQAEDVADAVEEAWQDVFVHSSIGGTAHEPYIDGCSSVLNIQLRDGKGWSGIAYWGSPGSCNIGIDAPMILNGVGTGDDGVIAHEVQHYTQYSYDDGCYDDFRPLYPGQSWIEGWANWAGKNALNSNTDSSYSVSSYNDSNSYYDLSYTNLFQGYLIQQYGGNGAPGDPEFGVNAVYEHYRQCDQADDIFVMDQTISALTGGSKTEKWAFVDFLAAYYARSYADAATQPELIFSDADDSPSGSPSYSQNVSMSGGSNSWTESSPEDWTASYYRIAPQAGCDFVELHVETDPPGGEVGINFMATKTSAPVGVQRSAHIGDSATRFFAGAGANNELVVIVASFGSIMTYDVEANCVTPTLNILEPVHNPGHAMVGDPSSPIATLTRFEVTSSGLPVSGIDSSTLSFDAEGDAPTMVPGSLQEVGPGEYWGVIIPPMKPGGTTFVDYQICLNTTICDTETDALLYVDPGNVDTVYVFDESGSMATEDTPGEGTRIDNAKKAGTVLADLLKDGDRIGIIGHGGLDNPPGCGLPGGDGNCANGNIVRLARINNVSVPGDIVITKAAVGSVTDRVVWTNTGQGLIDAKDMLLANPGNTNPDHIILLSDGRENANPLYDTPAVRDVLDAAGVCVDTIGLGPEAPGALLAQIAAQNCGTYMPVPTSGLGTSSLNSVAPLKNELTTMGVPAELANAIASVAAADFYPGQLGIANANEYIDVASQDSARLFHALYRNVPTTDYSTQSVVIDRSVSSFQFLAAGKQHDAQGVRLVELLMPGMDPAKPWIPVSPADGTTPTDWDIRNDPFQDVVIVNDPEPGTWGFRVRYAEVPGDYIMNLAVESPIRLEGNLLNLTSGQGKAGDVVPIVATLMDQNGLLPGAIVVAAIANEGGTDLTLLLDDGNNHDGAAGDGIYGWPYSLTNHGGSYSVRIVALFPDPANPANLLLREWNGGFWIEGPQEPGQDEDKDGMPDDWEERCKLNTKANDSQGDLDRDGLSNIMELELGTSPCQPDTDRGGEMDGSEVANGRNPLWAADDRVREVGHVQILGLDKLIWLNWSVFTDTMQVFVSTTPGQLGDKVDIGSTGSFSLTSLPKGGGFENGTPYYLIFSRFNPGDNAQGAYSNQYEVVPKMDPIPPQGAFLIVGDNVTDGGDSATSRNVTLQIDAKDFDGSYPGPASHSIPHGMIPPELAGLVVPSGNVEMRFSNDQLNMPNDWLPLADTLPWTLDCKVGDMCTVYGQFRDGAGNESLVIDQSIKLIASDLYIPIVAKGN